MNSHSKKTAFLPLYVKGVVLPGKHLGRVLGFPTANQDIPSWVDIPFGIYASTVELDGKSYRAVSNIGTCPTVSGEGVKLESHIFDFSGELYGKSIKTTLLSFLRDERKFSSQGELAAQIETDIKNAKSYFEKQEK